MYLHRQHCRLPIPNPNYSETSKLVYIYIDIDCPSLGLLDTPNLAFIKFSVLLKLLGGRTNEHPVQTHTYLHIYLFLHIFKTKLIHEMCLIPQPGCSPYNYITHNGLRTKIWFQNSHARNTLMNKMVQKYCQLLSSLNQINDIKHKRLRTVDVGTSEMCYHSVLLMHICLFVAWVTYIMAYRAPCGANEYVLCW